MKPAQIGVVEWKWLISHPIAEDNLQPMN